MLKNKNSIPHHFYPEKDIKKEYKFWKTQLVPQFDENTSNKLGPIKTEFKPEEIIKEPYPLPGKEMEWVLVDISKENELKILYEFLHEYYYEVEEYKESYSLEFLRWQFSPIKNNSHKNILLSIQINKKLIAFFSGLPMKLSVYGTELIVYNISFLCIDSNYRHKGLAEIMFKEMFRRTYLENVFQNIFVSKQLIPKPFCESTYYYKIFDTDKTRKKSKKRKISSIQDKTLHKFRLMEQKDIKDVCKLISEDQKKYKIYSIFSEDEVEHWFMPIKDVIYSFVKEDKNGNITDFTSFYVVNSFFDNSEEKWCYIYFNIATSISSAELFENSLILAKQNGISSYICNSINNYESLCKKFNFHSNIEDEGTYGSLKYYFNNFICPETEAKDISVILI